MGNTQSDHAEEAEGIEETNRRREVSSNEISSPPPTPNTPSRKRRLSLPNPPRGRHSDLFPNNPPESPSALSEPGARKKTCREFTRDLDLITYSFLCFPSTDLPTPRRRTRSEGRRRRRRNRRLRRKQAKQERREEAARLLASEKQQAAATAEEDKAAASATASATEDVAAGASTSIPATESSISSNLGFVYTAETDHTTQATTGTPTPPPPPQHISERREGGLSPETTTSFVSANSHQYNMPHTGRPNNAVGISQSRSGSPESRHEEAEHMIVDDEQQQQDQSQGRHIRQQQPRSTVDTAPHKKSNNPKHMLRQKQQNSTTTATGRSSSSATATRSGKKQQQQNQQSSNIPRRQKQRMDESKTSIRGRPSPTSPSNKQQKQKQHHHQARLVSPSPSPLPEVRENNNNNNNNKYLPEIYVSQNNNTNNKDDSSSLPESITYTTSTEADSSTVHSWRSTLQKSSGTTTEDLSITQATTMTNEHSPTTTTVVASPRYHQPGVGGGATTRPIVTPSPQSITSGSAAVGGVVAGPPIVNHHQNQQKSSFVSNNNSGGNPSSSRVSAARGFFERRTQKKAASNSRRTNNSNTTTTTTTTTTGGGGDGTTRARTKPSNKSPTTRQQQQHRIAEDSPLGTNWSDVYTHFYNEWEGPSSDDNNEDERETKTSEQQQHEAKAAAAATPATSASGISSAETSLNKHSPEEGRATAASDSLSILQVESNDLTDPESVYVQLASFEQEEESSPQSSFEESLLTVHDAWDTISPYDYFALEAEADEEFWNRLDIVMRQYDGMTTLELVQFASQKVRRYRALLTIQRWWCKRLAASSSNNKRNNSKEGGQHSLTKKDEKFNTRPSERTVKGKWWNRSGFRRQLFGLEPASTPSCSGSSSFPSVESTRTHEITVDPVTASMVIQRWVRSLDRRDGRTSVGCGWVRSLDHQSAREDQGYGGSSEAKRSQSRSQSAHVGMSREFEILRIQRWWRRKVLQTPSNMVSDKHDNTIRGAVVLQRWWRSTSASNLIKSQRAAIIMIQCSCRQHMARSISEARRADREAQNQRAACITIQSFVRQHIARSTLEALRAEQEAKLEGSATIIGSVFRAFVAASLFKRQQESSVKIQSIVRRSSATAVSRNLRASREAMERDSASLKIQAWWRKHHHAKLEQRKAVAQMSAAVLMQHWWSSISNQKRSRAATRIQSWWRPRILAVQGASVVGEDATTNITNAQQTIQGSGHDPTDGPTLRQETHPSLDPPQGPATQPSAMDDDFSDGWGDDLDGLDDDLMELEAPVPAPTPASRSHTDALPPAPVPMTAFAHADEGWDYELKDLDNELSDNVPTRMPTTVSAAAKAIVPSDSADADDNGWDDDDDFFDAISYQEMEASPPAMPNKALEAVTAIPPSLSAGADGWEDDDDIFEEYSHQEIDAPPAEVTTNPEIITNPCPTTEIVVPTTEAANSVNMTAPQKGPKDELLTDISRGELLSNEGVDPMQTKAINPPTQEEAPSTAPLKGRSQDIAPHLGCSQVGLPEQALQERDQPETKGSGPPAEVVGKANPTGGGSFVVPGKRRSHIAKYFVPRRTDKFEDHYDLGDFIGEGAFGEVYVCNSKENGAERAVKIIQKERMSEVDYEEVINEFNILKRIDNPNVIRMHEFFDTHDKFYIVQELAKGGELYDELETHGKLPEKETALLMKQVLSCVKYLHSQYVMHRDLNLENILLESNKDYEQLKIIDFGLGTTFEDGVRLTEMKGKVHYLAPEVLGEGGYGPKYDVWSLGVVAYTLLSGFAPFEAEDDADVRQLIVEGHVSFDDPEWEGVSPEARDFVAKLLTYNEEERPTAEEALGHPWIVSAIKESSEEFCKRHSSDAVDALSKMRSFTDRSKLKQAACSYIASQLLDKDEREEIDCIFRGIDSDCDGRLSVDDLKAKYQELNHSELSEKEIAEFFEHCDLTGTGYIDYSEFVIASMQIKDDLDEDKLRSCFNNFDSDHTGFISVANLKEAMINFHNEDDPDGSDSDMEQVDDGLGPQRRISFQEFKEMMHQDTCEQDGTNENEQSNAKVNVSPLGADHVPLLADSKAEPSCSATEDVSATAQPEQSILDSVNVSESEKSLPKQVTSPGISEVTAEVAPAKRKSFLDSDSDSYSEESSCQEGTAAAPESASEEALANTQPKRRSIFDDSESDDGSDSDNDESFPKQATAAPNLAPGKFEEVPAMPCTKRKSFLDSDSDSCSADSSSHRQGSSATKASVPVEETAVVATTKRKGFLDSDSDSYSADSTCDLHNAAAPAPTPPVDVPSTVQIQPERRNSLDSDGKGIKADSGGRSESLGTEEAQFPPPPATAASVELSAKDRPERSALDSDAEGSDSDSDGPSQNQGTAEPPPPPATAPSVEASATVQPARRSVLDYDGEASDSDSDGPSQNQGTAEAPARSALPTLKPVEGSSLEAPAMRPESGAEELLLSSPTPERCTDSAVKSTVEEPGLATVAAQLLASVAANVAPVAAISVPQYQGPEEEKPTIESFSVLQPEPGLIKERKSTDVLTFPPSAPSANLPQEAMPASGQEEHTLLKPSTYAVFDGHFYSLYMGYLFHTPTTSAEILVAPPTVPIESSANLRQTEKMKWTTEAESRLRTQLPDFLRCNPVLNGILMTMNWTDMGKPTLPDSTFENGETQSNVALAEQNSLNECTSVVADQTSESHTGMTPSFAAFVIQLWWKFVLAQREQKRVLEQRSVLCSADNAFDSSFNSAAQTIQRWWRSKLSIEGCKLEQLAAIKIQSLARRHSAAALFGTTKLTREAESLEAAATAFQCWWRSKLAIAAFKRHQLAAIKIQSLARRQSVAGLISTKKALREAESIESVAQTIQRWWKGVMTRRKEKADVAEMSCKQHRLRSIASALAQQTKAMREMDRMLGLIQTSLDEFGAAFVIQRFWSSILERRRKAHHESFRLRPSSKSDQPAKAAKQSKMDKISEMSTLAAVQIEIPAQNSSQDLTAMRKPAVEDHKMDEASGALQTSPAVTEMSDMEASLVVQHWWRCLQARSKQRQPSASTVVQANRCIAENLASTRIQRWWIKTWIKRSASNVSASEQLSHSAPQGAQPDLIPPMQHSHEDRTAASTLIQKWWRSCTREHREGKIGISNENPENQSEATPPHTGLLHSYEIQSDAKSSRLEKYQGVMATLAHHDRAIEQMNLQLQAVQSCMNEYAAATLIQPSWSDLEGQRKQQEEGQAEVRRGPIAVVDSPEATMAYAIQPLEMAEPEQSEAGVASDRGLHALHSQERSPVVAKKHCSSPPLQNQEQLSSLAEAAPVIQKWWRNLIHHEDTSFGTEDLVESQKGLMIPSEAVLLIQNWWKTHSRSGSTSNENMAHAASIIQQWWKSCVSARGIMPLNDSQITTPASMTPSEAAIIVQSWWRCAASHGCPRTGSHQCLTTSRDMEDEAACQIQQWWRMRPPAGSARAVKTIAGKRLIKERKSTDVLTFPPSAPSANLPQEAMPASGQEEHTLLKPSTYAVFDGHFYSLYMGYLFHTPTTSAEILVAPPTVPIESSANLRQTEKMKWTTEAESRLRTQLPDFLRCNPVLNGILMTMNWTEMRKPTLPDSTFENPNLAGKQPSIACDEAYTASRFSADIQTIQDNLELTIQDTLYAVKSSWAFLSSNPRSSMDGQKETFLFLAKELSRQQDQYAQLSKASFLHQEKIVSATKVQSCWRMYVVRRNYKRFVTVTQFLPFMTRDYMLSNISGPRLWGSQVRSYLKWYGYGRSI